MNKQGIYRETMKKIDLLKRNIDELNQYKTRCLDPDKTRLINQQVIQLKNKVTFYEKTIQEIKEVIK